MKWKGLSSMGRGKQISEYYIGLDIGTNSVGWAVTDPQYNVIKKNGKALWGIRLFEEGKTAEERRLFRTSRRRTGRRSRRIDLLQELFSEEICKVDPGFFRRMEDSKYLPEDKYVRQKNALFCDPGYTDKEYHKAYPTIYHLRKALMTEDHPFDVRLVYLALHHMIKHRGHFLFDRFQTSDGGASGVTGKIQELMGLVEEYLDIEPMTFSREQAAAILTSRENGISKKAEALQKCLPIGKDKRLKELCKLLAGGKIKLSTLFGDEDLKDFEKNGLTFSDAGYEDSGTELQNALGDRYDLLAKAKEVYDRAVLAELLGKCQYLSDAKIAIYEKHKKDLARLKNLLKPYPAVYKEIFQETGKGSYSAYVGICVKNGKKQVIEKRSERDEFYDTLKKKLKSLPDSQERQHILGEMDSGMFLPKSVSKDNGVIPHQLHEQELSLILKKAEGYLSFLKEKDTYGSVSDKIKSLLTFRIPYYVGPLNSYAPGKETHPFAWAVHKAGNGRIYPWNFSDKIDIGKSAEGFIRRMTNKCTYLLGEDVLPKNSLLYSRFTVLNELNNVRIGAAGEKLTPQQKARVIQDLFMKKSKVTNKAFRDYLIHEGIAGKEDAEIAGIDGDFKASLKPWIDMKKIFGSSLPSMDRMETMIEEITLFGADKKMLGRMLEKHKDLSTGQVKSLVKLKYEGWGRLSRKLLTETYPNPDAKGVDKAVDRTSGELMNLITALEKTNYNLMELLASDVGYQDAIENENQECMEEAAISPSTLETMRVSPSVRRPIWQTLSIVKEIRHITGHDPKRIFIEMARGGEPVKKRTVSRKARLLELYKSCKGEERDWLSELNAYPEEKLRSDRLYLYYTQMGRCMYSGEPIDIRQLWDKNVYDIDHIYPQSLTADDSLDNRVLVKKTLNAAKSDTYPIREDIRGKMKNFWHMLEGKDLISEKKYKRLVRNTRLTEDEKASFIGRQLVETRQGTKAVAEILKRVFADTTIVYAKAGNVSRFRQDFNFIKVRDVNDFHHAKDAYLNVVVGNVYYTKFTANPVSFLREKNPVYSLNAAMYKHEVQRGGVTAWIPGEDGSMAAVRKWMGKNNILFTRQAAEQTGGFFDQLPVKKGKGQVPLKNDGSPISDIQKYGGYNKAAAAYFMLVQGLDTKNNPVRILIPVPLYLKKQLDSEEAKLRYCEKLWESEGKLRAPQLVMPKILYNSLLEINGFRMHLSGKSGKSVVLKNSMQLCLSDEETQLVKRIAKFNERARQQKNAVITEFDHITVEALDGLYATFLQKLKHGIYKEKLPAVGKTLEGQESIYQALSLEEKCSVLSEILHVFQCTAQLSDLKQIGGPGQAGMITLPVNLTKAISLYYIAQSPTGFFEHKTLLSFK